MQTALELFSDPSAAADKVFSADVDKDAIPAMFDPVVSDSMTVDGVMPMLRVHGTPRPKTRGSGAVPRSMVRAIAHREASTWIYSKPGLKRIGPFSDFSIPARALQGRLQA